jgi:fluoride ion exporter CrcB/FEX
MVEKARGLLAATIVILGLSLGMVAISISTEHWMDIVVDSDSITSSAKSTDYHFWTRYRGLIRICFPDVTVLAAYDDVVDGWCLYEKGYEISRDPATINYGANYEYRIHMMRAMFVVLGLACIVLFAASFVVGNGCLTSKASRIRAGSIIAAVGGFLIACAMALFHGIEYLENEKITTSGSGFPASYATDSTYTELDEYSLSSYGYSYFLGWVGCFLAFLAALFGLCTAYNMSVDKRKGAEEDNMALEQPSQNGYDGYGDPYAEASAAYPPQEVSYPGYGDSYGGYGGYDAYNSYGRY